uniref:Protein kinase domain-containing protein n=1 Tax=Trichobilharzia regenti TaxID=157069 RepID=A0AA85KBI8_TRIRE|nr:unnamed protein product [Trichobilharzia regenti]CAH8847186.1 unnamed protein product [Trichobilharzia regenti]
MHLLNQKPFVNQNRLEDLYEIQHKIGDGHFADVNLSICKKTNKKYAAKFIMKQRFSSGCQGSTLSDIDREAFILANLQHENIVNLHEVFYREDSVVLILDLVTGGELFARVADCERLSEEEASNFVQQILLGVQHMHGLGIVHLDLKPENIMIEDLSSRKIKIIDFGLARVLNPNESFQDMAGTPEFCAPEIVNFDPITFATDMWAVGVLTYILLTGISPFAGDTQLETFQNILDCIVDYSREEIENVSDLAKDFIQKLLVKNPRKRATVNECLQHPWIKPKDNKQSNRRRDSLISREKLSSLRNFIATNPNSNSLSVNNSGGDQQNKPPSSPTSPAFALELDEKPRFSLPDNYVSKYNNNNTNNTFNHTLPDKGDSLSSNNPVENKQLHKNDSKQSTNSQNNNNCASVTNTSRNNNNKNTNTVQTDKTPLVNHVIEAKNLSNCKISGIAHLITYSNPSPSHVDSRGINSKTSENQNSNCLSISNSLTPASNAKKSSPLNSFLDSTPSFPYNSPPPTTSMNTFKGIPAIIPSNSNSLSADKSSSVSNTNAGGWRTTLQNNIIGRLGAAFAAATGHVTPTTTIATTTTTSTTTGTFTYHNETGSTNSKISNNDKSVYSSDKSHNPNDTLYYLPKSVTDLKSKVQVDNKVNSNQSVNTKIYQTEVTSSEHRSSSTSTVTTVSTDQKLSFVQLTSKEMENEKVSEWSKTSNKNTSSSFGVVSRAVKELEITSSPISNIVSTSNNNNKIISESKIVRRFQSLGMNQLTDITCINGYPNEKINPHRGPICNPSNRIMVSKLQEIFESGSKKEIVNSRNSRTMESPVSPITVNSNNNNNSAKENLAVKASNPTGKYASSTNAKTS